MPKKPLITVPSISRRTRRRGLWLSGTVGLLTLVVGFARTPHTHYDTVVMTTQALPAGTVVSASDVFVQKVPAPGVTGAARAVAAVVGRTLHYAVVAHQPMMTGDIQNVQLVQGLAPGQVGVMLPVSLASSDNVRPGDLVRVIWLGGSSNTSSSNAAASITLSPGSSLASGLRVLAVLNSQGTALAGAASKSGGLSANTPASVEVAAPQQLAGTLSLAAQSGQFWLTLDPWSATPGAAASNSSVALNPISSVPPTSSTKSSKTAKVSTSTTSRTPSAKGQPAVSTHG